MRKKRNLRRQRRRVTKVPILVSFHYIQRGPPSPVWSPLAQEVLHLPSPACLSPCSCCSSQPLLIVVKTRSIDTIHIHNIHGDTLIHTHMHTPCNGPTILDCKVKKAKWRNGLHIFIISPDVLDFSFHPIKNGTLFNMVWLKLQLFKVLQAQETQS